MRAPTSSADPLDQHAEVPRLWTQRQAAEYLAVTPRYLRDSRCPKIFLPGNGSKGNPVVRYDPAEVQAWAHAWRAGRQIERRAS